MKDASKFICALGFVSVLFNASPVSAHGVLVSVSQNKTVGNNQITFEATADSPEIYTKYAITYRFGLFDKSGENEVPYDDAYVTFTKKDGGLIASANVVGPKDFMPGGQMDVAIQEPGDYVAEVIFVQNKPSGDNTEIKAGFDFKAVSAEDSEGTIPTPDASSDAGKYMWVLLTLVIGIVAGRLSSQFFKSS